MASAADLALREEESVALQAIYDTDFVTLDDSEWQILLPDVGASLGVKLPAGYPSAEAPIPCLEFTGSRADTELLKEELRNLWQPGEGCMFQWVEHVKFFIDGLQAAAEAGPDTGEPVPEPLVESRAVPVSADVATQVGKALVSAGFLDCSGGVFTHSDRGVTVEILASQLTITVDGIDAEDLMDWATIQIDADAGRFGVRLLDWVQAQRSPEPGFLDGDDDDFEAPGLECLPSPSSLAVKTDRTLHIYTWGKALRKAPPPDSQFNFNAGVLNGRGGGADLRTMNGLSEEVQNNILSCGLFPRWIEMVISKIEGAGLHTVSINCTKGRHRSVAAAELLRKVYYPGATMKHLTIY